MKTTVIENIRTKINKSKPGNIFFISSFAEYDEEYITKLLASFVNDKILVRISNGIYMKPIISKFGIVYPSNYEIVSAIAKRDKAKILATGNTALNQLGYSTQVPMNSEYITNGSARVIEVEGRTIKLKRSAPKNFEYKGDLMPILVQALKAIGQKQINVNDLAITQRLLIEHPESQTWEKDIQLAPTWIKKIIISIKKNIENAQMDR